MSNDNHIAPIAPVDLQQIAAEAHRARARYLAKLVRMGFGRLAAAWKRHRAYLRALAELNGMDDRSLQDVGITRGEITYAAAGKLGDRNPWRAPANSDIKPARDEHRAAA